MQKMRKDNQDNSKKRTYRLIPIKNIMETKELEQLSKEGLIKEVESLKSALQKEQEAKELWYKSYKETESKLNSLRSVLQSTLNLIK